MTHLFAEPIDAELEGVQPQAARLAAIMGLVAGVAVEAPTARWRITDTSAAEFGQEVATDLFLSPATGVARSSVALASLRESCSASTNRTPSSELGRRTSVRQHVEIEAWARPQRSTRARQ